MNINTIYQDIVNDEENPIGIEFNLALLIK